MPAFPRPVGLRWIALAIVGLCGWACAATHPSATRRSDPPPVASVILPTFDVDATAANGGRPPARTLAVRDVQPEGPGDGDASIRLRLNRAIVDVDAPPVGVALALERIDAEGHAHPVAARSRWTRGDVLTLVPEDELAAATAYVVRLEGRLEHDGVVVEGTTWRFETARPSFDLVAAIDDDLAEGAPLWLVPSLPMDPAVLGRHLRIATVLDPDGVRERLGAPLAVRVRAATPAELREHGLPEHALAIVPARRWPAGATLRVPSSRWPAGATLRVPSRRWPAGATLRVDVDDGVTAQAGPLPIARAWRTRVAIRPRFALGRPRCGGVTSTRCPLGPIEVPIGAALDDPSYAEIRVVPEPESLEITPDYDDDDGVTPPGPEALRIDADWLPNQRYAIVFGRDVFDVHGRRLQGPRRVAVEFGDTRAPHEATLALSSGAGIFATPKDARIGVVTDGVTELRVRTATLRAEDEAALALVGAADPSTLPWPVTDREVVVDHVIRPGHGRVFLELGEHAGSGDVVVVEATAQSLAPSATPPQHATVRGVFRISDLGVVIHRGPREGFVRVTSTASGDPIAGARVRRFGEFPTDARTDRHGLVPLDSRDIEGRRALVLVEHGDDAVALRSAAQPWLDARTTRHGRMRASGALVVSPRPGTRPSRRAELRAGELPRVAIFTGRAVYQPGDAIHLAGWATISTPYGTAATRRVPAGTAVRIALHRDGELVASERQRIDRHGRFVTTMRLAEAARLGDYTISATVLGEPGSASFVVAEPRLPSFTLATHATAGTILRGTPIAITARARYLSGEAATLSGARADIMCSPTTWWADDLPLGFSTTTDVLATSEARTPAAILDGASARFEVPTDDLDHRVPYGCSVAIAASDAALQEVGVDAHVVVHPARVYLASKDLTGTAGQRRVVELLAVDHAGHRVPLAGLDVAVLRVEDDDVTPVVRCVLEVDAEGEPARCRTPRLRAGSYRMVARAEIDGAPIEQTRAFRIEPPPRRAAPQFEPPPPIAAPVERPRPFEVRLPETVRPGAPVFAEVTGPWDDATGVLAVEQIGLRAVVPFTLHDGRARVRIPVTPDLGSTVEVIARVAEADRELTAHADTGVVDTRRLEVRVGAPRRVPAGRATTVRVEVLDTANAPVDARLAIWVVDEAVHELRRAMLPDLGALFGPSRHGERGVARTYDALLEPDFGFGRRQARAPSVRMASGSVKGNVDVTPRRRFDAAPLFIGDVGTGPDGVHTLELPLPDDLTRFQVVVIASAPLHDRPQTGPARFGIATAKIETTAPLNVRAALPRALRPGDDASIAALVTMPHAGEIEAVLELDDPGLRALGPTTRRVRGAAGETVRIPFRVHADAPGTPRVRFAARFQPARSRRSIAGAVEQRLRIAAERTQGDAVAIYGSLDRSEPIAVPIRLPARAVPNTGEVEVHATSTATGELTDAADYLSRYPYGCAEQTASRLVPMIALVGLGDRGAATAEATAAAAEIVARLDSMQRADGRFAYWPNTTRVDRFASVYATWILQLAHDRGVAVPPGTLTRARAALVDPDALPDTMDTMDADARLAEVLALHVRAQGDAATAADFDAVLRGRAALSASGRMLLAMALHRAAPDDPRLPEVVRELAAWIEERAGVAHVVAPRSAEPASWDSPTRDDAIGLMAWMQLVPDDPRVDALARGLAARRVRGRWRTTQENAFALLALASYAASREAEVPDHRVQAWIGDRPVLDAEVRGFDTVARGGAVALDALRVGPDRDAAQVVLRRVGAGRVHWRVGVRWTEAAPPPRAQGLSLDTRILDEDDVAVTALVAGRRYRIEVVLASDTPQQYVAVDVPLPAGVEAVDRSLGAGVAARAAATVDSRGLSHLELRPDRVLLFFDTLEPGTTVQQIPVLATAAGTYALPGAVAEAMYEPETRARTAARRIAIDDPRQPGGTNSSQAVRIDPSAASKNPP